MKQKYFILIFCLILMQCLTAFQSVEAITANPTPVKYKQPDGLWVTLHLNGDEFIHWATTTDGYMVLPDKNGYYEYAKTMPDGRIGFSGVLAHDPGSRNHDETGFIGSIHPGLIFSGVQLQEMKKYLAGDHAPDAPSIGGFPTTGVNSHLMILANFSNTNTTYTQDQFDNLMNQVNYNGTGSFKDFYLEVSYGSLTVNTDVTIWVTLPHPHDYYGPQSMWGEFAYDAVVAADQQAGVDFSLYDNDGDGAVDGVCIAHQGRGQEETGNVNDIWSHSWTLAAAGYTPSQRIFDGVQVNEYTTIPEKGSSSSMTSIGVMCHEFGHNLGAPDFYDTDYNTGGQYDGTGNWDIMADGSWNGNPAGSKPAQHNAWTKSYFTWTNPTILTSLQNVLLRQAETYTDVIRYNTATPNEYFLCENRQKTGFDTYIPGHGLIIYHVDGSYITAHMNANNINANSHQGMYPMSATSNTPSGIMPSSGSTINTGGCPWPGNSNKTTFSDATTPNSKSWSGSNTDQPLINISENNSTKEVTFCFIACPDPDDPTNFLATPASSTLIELGWEKNAANHPVMVAYTVTGTFGTPVNGTAYAVGDPIAGGGTIIYNGADTTYDHAGLTPNTTYYYKAWSVMAGEAYSTGVITNATTLSTPTLTVTPANQDVPATPAGDTSFTVTSNSPWSVESDQAWCTVNPSGSGNGTITAGYSVNLLTTSRVAHITTTVSGIPPVVVTVTQAGDLPTLSVTPPNQNVTSSNGFTTFTVVSNTTWSVAGDVEWIVTTPSGSGNDSIHVTFDENPGITDRVATITVTATGIAPVTVTVIQSGAVPALIVTPPNQDVTALQGTTSFNVASNTSWTVSSDAAWCKVPAAGSGNGTLVAEYTANSANQARTANISVSVNGLPVQTVTVSQAKSTIGIDEMNDNSLSIFPNPTSGLFSIKVMNGAGNVMNIAIIDKMGKTVFSDEYKGKSIYDFDLRKFARGEYIIKITSGGKVLIRKIVLQ
jgi:M6 family metalloprotease-like protein